MKLQQQGERDGDGKAKAGVAVAKVWSLLMGMQQFCWRFCRDPFCTTNTFRDRMHNQSQVRQGIQLSESSIVAANFIQFGRSGVLSNLQGCCLRIAYLISLLLSGL